MKKPGCWEVSVCWIYPSGPEHSPWECSRELVARRKLLEPDCPEPDLIRAVLEENIYGVDVCAEALEVARFRFRCAWLAAGGKGDLRDRLLRGDSLDMSASGVWRQGLSTVMEEGGFDLVIGNPPFVGEKGTRNYLTV